MIDQSIEEIIEKIVEHNNTNYTLLKHNSKSLRGLSIDRKKVINEANLLRAQLEEKSTGELRSMHNKINIEKNKIIESFLPYNANYSDADFTFWSKMTTWTKDQFIALSFGKKPEIVSWDLVSKHKDKSPFAKKYNHVRRLVTNAVEHQVLKNIDYPKNYMHWAQNNNIDLPEKLVDLILKDSNINSETEITPKKNIIFQDKLSTNIGQNEYQSPYIELMQRLIKENNITSDNQPKQEILKQWFLDNAPAELLVTPTKASNTATLCRLPKSAKGGNKKLKVTQHINP